MRKIPTLFRRDPADPRRLLADVHPACHWVLAGEGTATRKYDGVCVMLDDTGAWWARREVKPGNTEPPGFVTEQHDDTTGKTVGWEPVEQSPFHRHMPDTSGMTAGTYELCGPRVNGDPEGYGTHVLVAHGRAEPYPPLNHPAGHGEVAAVVATLPWEGVVWHHPDGRMAKVKRRDFP
ncbi:MAG: hypothetical protein ACREX8_00765 [Gammaproteobacteria bacterium]